MIATGVSLGLSAISRVFLAGISILMTASVQPKVKTLAMRSTTR